jgi:pimeloyl-ACP methyl ester carboxylesterase
MIFIVLPVYLYLIYLYVYFLLGKLPPPKPFNDLLREFEGPVLIAQGALDPLNDAKSRAKSFANIRSDVEVSLLELGHCPMDENPDMVGILYYLN